MINVSPKDSDTDERSANKDEAKLVGEDITQWSGGNLVIHKISPFTAKDNIEEIRRIQAYFAILTLEAITN